MATAWTDPFPDYPPLDVRVLSVAILRILEVAMRRNRRVDDPPVMMSDMQDVAKEVEDLVTRFDGIRTEHLKFLKGELMRLHNLTVQPLQLFPKQP